MLKPDFFSSPRKILVTGAAGFIASRTVALLHEAGHEVVGLDNFNDAYDTRLKEWRWAQLQKMVEAQSKDTKDKPRLTLHKLDISQTEDVAALFRWQGTARPFEAVINLAARAGVRASVENPHVYVQTNLAGWVNLLEIGREYGVQKFVLASTSSLYGKDHPMPYHEELNTDRVLSPYAATKKAAEAMAYTFHYLHQLDISVLRYFTVYGPACRPDMAPFRFVQRIREGQPITVFGDGTQSRDFTYVDDIVRGTIAALKPVGYEVFNLGSDTPIKLSEMIRLIEELTGRTAKIESKPGHPADVPATWANIEKAKRELGWKPQTGFREGFHALTQWYEDNREWAQHVKTD